MAGDFYDKQINKVEANDKLREYNWLINDYLTATNKEDRDVIKDLIIKKAIKELNPKELTALKDKLSEKWQREEWKNKIKLYELTAWLYNNTPLINLPNQNQPVQPMGQQEYYNENVPFEIGRIKIDWDDNFILNRKEIKQIWNWKYQVDLDISKPRWKYLRVTSNISIIIEYSWGNVINVINPDYPDRIISQIQIRNKREINIWHWRIVEPNLFVTIPFKHYNKNIELELSLPNR